MRTPAERASSWRCRPPSPSWPTSAQFVGLITATCERFPETPPYEGAFDAPEPHLTIAEASDGQPIDGLIEAAERELAPALPLLFRVDAAALFEEQSDGTWVAGPTFPLG